MTLDELLDEIFDEKSVHHSGEQFIGFIGWTDPS